MTALPDQSGDPEALGQTDPIVLPPRRRPRRRFVVLVAVAATAAIAVAAVVAHVESRRGNWLGARAVVTASSTAAGYSVRDVVSTGSAARPGAAWRSGRQTVGAWIQLRWDTPHDMDEVALVRNPLTEPGLTAGFLTFGDGSLLQVRLSTQDRVTTVRFTRRSADAVRFTATEVSGGATSVTLAELTVGVGGSEGAVAAPPADGDVARTASLETPGAADPGALVDGPDPAQDGGAGATWHGPAGSDGVLRLRWSQPQEVDAVVLRGSAETPGSGVHDGLVTFSDGTTLAVPAVLSTTALPTTVAFMPRVVSSLTVTLHGADPKVPVALSELGLYARGTTPPRSEGTGPGPAGVGLPDPAACADDGAPSQVPLVLVCPSSGSLVDTKARLVLALGPRYDRVEARIVGDQAPAIVSSTEGGDPGRRVSLELDTSKLQPGPFTVRLGVSGPGQDDETVLAQLVRSGELPGVASSPAAAGRTLVDAEEFAHPLSLSRTGLGAEYAAAKPVHDGAQDFGDAIFPDPADGFGNVGVVDGGLLHLGVEPLPAGRSDPDGFGRTHLGGLLASAREGGSGFSAQFGYFEARMFVPAATGTWPAFWLLPSDNLVAPTSTVAEVDAVELYGHDPRGACHSTHEFVGGKDGGVARCGRRFDSIDRAVGWHTYGVSVEPTENVFFIDGREVARAPQVRGGDSPMFFLVDLALGGGWPVDLDATRGRADLFVDYVRTYV